MSNQTIINYWFEKAKEDLASANGNYSMGRHANAVRDAYFACFHAFSSLLLKSGKTFSKHKEVRVALHRDFVRMKKIDSRWGKHYDWLYDNRQKADYRPLAVFEPDQVKEIIEQSEEFVAEMRRLADQIVEVKD
jgi:uncharacterized protein (UPF0332 family)